MDHDRAQIDRIRPQARSKIANGSRMLEGIDDGRSTIARRLRDIVRGLLVEFDSHD